MQRNSTRFNWCGYDGTHRALMAILHPIRGVRFNPDVVRLGRVLAPPYDVINPALQGALYERDLRNIVRIDHGREYPGDVPGEEDRYTRARAHLDGWIAMDVLQRDLEPCLYVSEHRFSAPDGTPQQRRGLFVGVDARPWESSDLRPHERTMRGPKADRLALMQATAMQTSPVFAIWKGAPGMAEMLNEITLAPPAATGRADGELGSEQHALWVVRDEVRVRTIIEAFAGARLYVADGHHRYETAATYASDHRDRTDAGRCLLYLCAADDPSLELLPTHRLVGSPAGGRETDGDGSGAGTRRGAVAGRGGGLPVSPAELQEQLPGFAVERRSGLAEAMADAAARRTTHHAFAVATREAVVLISRPRQTATVSPRAVLDVVVLEEEILEPLGITSQAIADGALTYTRVPEVLLSAVHEGDAAVGIAVNPCTTAEVMAVADAGETMPQKSTYFYPKVPTGLVLSPL